MRLGCLQTSLGSRHPPSSPSSKTKGNSSRESCSRELHPNTGLGPGTGARAGGHIQDIWAGSQLEEGSAAKPMAQGSGSHLPAELCGTQQPVVRAGPSGADLGWCPSLRKIFSGSEGDASFGNSNLKLQQGHKRIR